MGRIVMELYATMPTAQLARQLGLTPKQIANFIYRNNTEPWARKDPAVLSAENRANGKRGGRGKKSSKK